MDEQSLSLAKRLWNEGDALEAGRMIYEGLSPGGRVMWARGILRVAADSVGICNPLYEELLSLPPTECYRAMDCFDRIRNQTLVFESESGSWKTPSIEYILSLLAENVAKVMHDDGCPEGEEYDEDTGWWIVKCLSDMTIALGSQGMKELYWEVAAYGTDNRGTHAE